MLARRRVSALSVLLVACGVGVLGAAGSAGAAPPAATNGKTYVALGDSYAAGFGLPAPSAPTGKPVPGCEQTTGDYPHILAAKLGLKLTDVACSGATTVDFTSGQDVTGQDPPPQLDAFKTVQPALVTITIGGNDLGFTDIAKACIAATPQGPVVGNGTSVPSFASCQAYFGSSAANGGKKDNPYDKLAGVIAKVKAAIAAVQKAAPKAKVAVIAYPAIAPDRAHTPATGCFTSVGPPPNNPAPSVLPFTDVDIPYLQVLQQNLDTGIGRAANQLGASYADIYPASLSRSACTPENVRWVEPVVPGGGGTNVLHPSLAGTTAMAAALAPVVQRLLTPTPTRSPTPSASSSPVAAAAAPTLAPTSAAPQAAAAAPLANSGPGFPVGGAVLVGVLLIASGGVMVRLASWTGARTRFGSVGRARRV